MPTYRGQSIFGINIRMETTDNPRQEQLNAFFGLSGVEMLDGGLRGRFTLVKFRLYGATGPDLAAAENLVRSFQDGLIGTLVDNLGNAWPNVKLQEFGPADDRIRFSPGLGYTRRYQARLFHLS